ncbi:ribbon-helix-helix protein, CopG family [Geomesophilobacter sediminis]|uniref:Ribbon-helix-helix protein, CopG family n=1 Tax=Geomesophilobacter sediminis TaxID=2798584 RepID=A0A8J7SBT7_9BACT|nr:ribbon-helix-helix protein, CopG family [Geomesophilobacter sediminis]MBJ6727956.1 ribbon-helix-helix protein, CopG family [Geomesophilobacter sediminis]
MQGENLALAPTRRTFRKKESKGLNNVVSLRISDQEKRVLDRISAATQSNLSDLVRKALDFWLATRSGIRMEP